MAKYTTKRTYTKKPTATKKVIKKVKKEVVDVVEPSSPTVEIKTVWEKVKSWVKGVVG